MKKLFFKISSVIIFIQNQNWKYVNGTNIGDWLGKDSFEIKDGIIYGNSGKAKIVFSFGQTIVIEDITTNQRGFYINKN